MFGDKKNTERKKEKTLKARLQPKEATDCEPNYIRSYGRNWINQNHIAFTLNSWNLINNNQSKWLPVAEWRWDAGTFPSASFLYIWIPFYCFIWLLFIHTHTTHRYALSLRIRFIFFYLIAESVPYNCETFGRRRASSENVCGLPT